MGDNLITYTEVNQIKTDFSTKINANQSSFEFILKASDIESIVSVGKIREFLYQEAITNLIKKSKFLQLYIQLIENQISEDEYDQELNGNQDDYFINLKEIGSGFDVGALVLILQTLPKSLSIDEVSEIFGIKTESLMDKLNA